MVILFTNGNVLQAIDGQYLKLLVKEICLKIHFRFEVITTISDVSNKDSPRRFRLNPEKLYSLFFRTALGFKARTRACLRKLF